MASGDQHPQQHRPVRYMTFSKYDYPFVGALHDCFQICWGYLSGRPFAETEQLYSVDKIEKKRTLVLVGVCLIVGFICNLKFEVIRFDDAPLVNDMHVLLMSQRHNIYTNEIDPTRLRCCVEMSDAMVLVVSCVMILLSEFTQSPVSEYLFLPWLGMSLRGMLTRQVPTLGALVYTVAVIDEYINMVFLANFLSLFIIQCQIWLDIVRLIRGRWERKDFTVRAERKRKTRIETLWCCDETDSVEMQNFVY